MSEARSLKASTMIWFTSRMSGASVSTSAPSSALTSTLLSVSSWMTSLNAPSAIVRFFAAVILVQRRLDVRLRGHAQFDFRVEQMGERINRVQVGRVGDGHGHLAFVSENGDDAVFSGDVARDDGDDVVLDLEAGQMHHFRAELRGLGLGHVAGPDDLVGHQQIHHAHAGGVGFLAGLGDHIGAGKAEVNQKVQQIIVFFCHEIFQRVPLLFNSGNALPERFHLSPQKSMQTRNILILRRVISQF